jgi:predicted O-methyltransferase YrrM
VMSRQNQPAQQYRQGRLYDEKGNRISWLQLYEPALAAALKVSQIVADRPYLPWVPFAVIRRLSRILTKNSRVLEYGSGRSTVWLARRAHSVVSIEDSQVWYEKVLQLFKDLQLTNVDYRLRSAENYSADSEFPDESFDLIIIDGCCRSRCLENAYGKLRRGGYLYLDNSDTDMTMTDGDMRRAEARMRQLAEQWSSEIEFYTGFAPGNLHAHQGALLRRP